MAVAQVKVQTRQRKIAKLNWSEAEGSPGSIGYGLHQLLKRLTDFVDFIWF
jgi:hypothetical protein